MTDKTEKKRTLITLSTAAQDALAFCMEKDIAGNVSEYIARLISERKTELTKRGPGRPKKDDEPEADDWDIENIPNPDKMDAPHNPMLSRNVYEARRKMSPSIYPPLS